MAGRYKAYPVYKDSGVEWLGEIPEGWELWKIAHAYLEIGSGTTPVTDNQNFFEGEIPWVTTSELRENVILETKKYLTTEAINTYTTLKKYPVGSIAIAMYGATIGRVGIFGIEATTNQACCVMPYSKIIFNKYLFYWLLAFKEEIIQLSSGGGQPNINQEKVSSLKVSCPTFSEQQTIAQFLDYETAKIDALIAKQEQLIELLKEKRQAVISHAVTKGLNPDAPMKDSGVEWLGQVPEHWKVAKLSYFLKLLSGDSITSSEIEAEGDFPVMGGNGLRGYTSKYNCNGEHAIIGRQGALCGNINVATGKFFASEHAVVVYPYTNFNIIFLSEFLRFMNLGQYSISAAQPGISVERVNGLYMAFPDYKEQEEIGVYIKSKIKSLNELKDQSEKMIQLLQERKTALISAAVTGKIDVRDWQPPSVG